MNAQGYGTRKIDGFPKKFILAAGGIACFSEPTEIDCKEI
jgi:hypothetical protein